jgi:hypothetical protein
MCAFYEGVFLGEGVDPEEEHNTFNEGTPEEFISWADDSTGIPSLKTILIKSIASSISDWPNLSLLPYELQEALFEYLHRRNLICDAVLPHFTELTELDVSLGNPFQIANTSISDEGLSKFLMATNSKVLIQCIEAIFNFQFSLVEKN